ncbi:MAG: zinc ribbon domain-containing protein [Bifidobacterium merycicum]|uniref:zinc ribbon domain-containing protein n=1 Tax=Bifidobacterium merycicum TaxID=78345 RepID=UPI000D1BEFDD|nr:zinc ribbon domain-containing protein [Bifidobacterium merycicum]MBQ1513280.1 zinc ribbon domain-containing protein [Bifidobacterium sp.]MEE1294382.1 zinc ribbon domain-containing protein [Bifidobacterium merycicum]MEE3341579.1 zinc ribbon domain-containing protein [Bifidobacterium merycicum]
MPKEYCDQCGQPLSPDTRFCPNCGEPVDIEATIRIPQGQLYMGTANTDSPASQPGGLASAPVPESDGVDMLSEYGGYDTYDQYGSEYDPHAPASYAPEQSGPQTHVTETNNAVSRGTNAASNANTDDADITASVIVRGPNGRPVSGNIPPSKHTDDAVNSTATASGNANGSYINVPAYTDDAWWGDAGQNDAGQTDQPAGGTNGSQPPAPQPAPRTLPSKPTSAKSKTGKGKTGKSKPSSTASRRHTNRVIAVAAAVCVIAILIGVSVTRMLSSGRNSTTSDSTSSASASSGKSTGTTKADGTKQSGKSTQSTSGNTGKKTDKQSTEQSDKQADKQTEAKQAQGGPYLNARFGYTVTVPDGFTWQQESDNGDGCQFTNDGLGMIITVSGTSNALNETLDSAFDSVTAGHPVSYQQKLGTEFTATWEENGTITYIRELYSADTLRTLRFDYPAPHRDQCDRIVEQVVPTFGITGTDAQ